jgi:hypothetical protein
MSRDVLSATEIRMLRRVVSERLREIRTELFGPDGGPDLARLVGVPAPTWASYEAGVIVPIEVVLAFLDVTDCSPRWLLMGWGPKYQHQQSPSDCEPAGIGR